MDNTIDFLRAVRDKRTVSPKQIQAFVSGAADGTLPDYQLTSFLMSVYHQGLSNKSTVALTLAMRDSGSVIPHPNTSAVCVDKHSTGGVGDKISIPLAPMVAACGVAVPMVSGRGLGHTGGTLDKLESIPGFDVGLPISQFQEMVATLGVSLIGQTGNIAPADRKLYALRDVTATVESIPLITASILSKKLAEGIHALVLDVKVGCGAFMKTEEDARALANSLVDVGQGAGLKIRALLTRMEQPIGNTIGNALEMTESLAVLRGEGPADTTELTLALGAEMLCLGGVANNLTEAREKLKYAVLSGAALQKMRAIVEAQGGDVSVIDDPSKLPTAAHVTTIYAPQKGYITAINAYELGTVAMYLGAGRQAAEDIIDHAVGLELMIKCGAKVSEGDPLLKVHHQSSDIAPNLLEQIFSAYSYAPKPKRELPQIIDTIG